MLRDSKNPSQPKTKQEEQRSLETMSIGEQDAVMTVSLERPDRLNAFTLGMMEDWCTVGWVQTTQPVRLDLRRLLLAPCLWHSFSLR